MPPFNLNIVEPAMAKFIIINEIRAILTTELYPYNTAGYFIL